MERLSFNLPGPYEINPDGVIPTGGINKLENIIQVGITLLFIVATLLALFFLIYGGIRWITSGGSKEGIDAARKTITYAIIGLVISFLAFFIINTIGNFFGVRLLDIPSRWCGPVVCP